ncbi:DEAD/DEAH box helicase family protein [Streptococcus danieliae]|uniref:DEAD/DEAH box helicase family protein n=1 Tax=Streptococcus danieliae TaxID=747656 RepID=A0A7Z0RRA9_9STRE|nr:DEAD/DEAH box helicase family protein [Streptococcus danieliae]MBF0717547.1 DEAD/DEAH box helicase family protein [Streptococcus danieliae]NYS49477.1 DEAD/DEAH box helicase family protein [Streptococcus danieliae]
MIELKQFQQKLVDKLLKFTAPGYGVDEMVIKSPTGSGKTITLLDWVNTYIASTHDNVAFVWFTPGAGELEEQSQEKARHFPSIQAQSVDDALLHGFDKDSVTFINYERVIGKKSKAMLTDSERDNLEDKIEKAFEAGRHFILIIDEAHRNDTKKARDIIARFCASKTVRVSATIEDPNQPDKVEFYEVAEEDVVASGLITKSVVVNEGLEKYLEGSQDISAEFELLFGIAEQKRREIVEAYTDNGVKGINPLVLVQLPDKSDAEPELVKRIETYIQEKLYKTYEDGKLGIWLANRKRNYLDVQQLDNEVEYLIIKQAIATGWDAPRAKILIKIRENMGEVFTIQTIGRIRRMPEPLKGHYGVEVLDNAYLYTFDMDFLNGAFAQKGVGAPTPLMNRKDVAKGFKLISERVFDLHEGQDEKAIRENLYQGLVREWNMTEDVESNKKKLENQGLQFGTSVINTYKQGRFDTLGHSDRLQDRERQVEADYRSNRLDLLHAYHELDRVTHLKVNQVEAILKRFFMKNERSKNHKLLKLTANEWTAFILNNWRTLREVFRQVDIQPTISMGLVVPRENDFYIPETERYSYNPKLDQAESVTNVYTGYTNSVIKGSEAERLFEEYIESHENTVEFIYKNGDKGSQYFSLVYQTASSSHHFYPDYIVKMKNGDVYIVETKGGETAQGQDKNIDEYASSKYEALKTYLEKYKLKGAFIRDVAGSLRYLNEGEWQDDMAAWHPIDDLFGF